MGNRRPNGYWKVWSNLRRELEKAIKENRGEFPTHRWLVKNGYSYINNAIQLYYGGYLLVRKKCGYCDSLRKSSDYWKIWENTKKELRKAIKENRGEFPTHAWLQKNGYSSIGHSIIEYHDGTKSVRERLGYEIKRLPNGYWRNFDNVKKELKLIIKKLGNFFTQKDLRRIERNDLMRGMATHHGGLTSVKEKLGLELKFKQRGYWKNWCNIEKELNDVISLIGYFPNHSDLIRIKKSSLSNAITFFGGIIAVREKLGYSNPRNSQLESFLESYVNGGKDE